ncbi:rhodanese-like domain-containing protein [Mariniflexile ostreae]|uniref:Rhodanese-like domain-containing protein n=1 Tax=Mariniflexile ostreae TaxID=1520892 RepID=A0ABV5F9L3_9FLAO
MNIHKKSHNLYTYYPSCFKKKFVFCCKIGAMGFWDFIFGAKKRQVTLFLENGATILDVRSKTEYDAGAVPKSIHIPLQELHNNIAKLKAMNTPFVVCCASGVRSAKATKFLNLNNIQATNGGGWMKLSETYNLID